MNAVDFHTRLLAGIACSPLFLLFIHMALARILRRASPQKVAVIAILLGYVPLTLLLYCLLQRNNDGLLFALAYAYMIYTGVAYTYFHFFNMSETARRIRILYEINKAGALSKEQILTLYDTESVIRIRLQRLVGTGQLHLQNGLYSISGKILYIAARAIAAWRRLLGLDRLKEH